MNGFRERIQHYIRQQARPTEKFGHQPRLYALAVEVGKGQIYDDDVLFAAAWLHDIGVFLGHRPEDPQALAVWDNTAYAMAQAPRILGDLDFPSAKCPAVVEAIRTHQPSGVPTTIEGQILRDADILEQLGAIGIVRTVSKIGRDTRFPDFTSAVASLRKALETLPRQIHLESARMLAQLRIEVLESFLRQLDAEAGADLH
jgi:uncharacterized protein